jgi:hypothetical protein
MSKNLRLISSFFIISSLTCVIEIPTIIWIERWWNTFRDLALESWSAQVLYPQRAAFTRMARYIQSFTSNGMSLLMNSSFSCPITMYDDAILFVISSRLSLRSDFIHNPR